MAISVDGVFEAEELTSAGNDLTKYRSSREDVLEDPLCTQKCVSSSMTLVQSHC